MTFPTELFPFLNTVAAFITTIIAIGLTIGGFLYAARNGRQNKLAEMQQATTATQEATNTALLQRIAVLEGQLEDEKREKATQKQSIELIIDTFEKRGILITVDGDIVTIADKSGVTTHRKRRTITTKAQGSP